MSAGAVATVSTGSGEARRGQVAAAAARDATAPTRLAAKVQPPASISDSMTAPSAAAAAVKAALDSHPG